MKSGARYQASRRFSLPNSWAYDTRRKAAVPAALRWSRRKVRQKAEPPLR